MGDRQIQKFHRKVKITSGLENSPRYLFDSGNSKMTSKLP